MLTEQIKIKKVRENAKVPTYGTEYAAGADLYACIEKEEVLSPSETKLIPTGISMAIPTGYVGLVYARSGIATKRGLAPANKVGVIDSDYRGEIFIALHNHSTEEKTISKEERIAQIVVAPYVKAEFIETEELDETVRGESAFGSTGTN